MTKAMLIISHLSLQLLFAGTYLEPNNPLFWLAGSSQAINIVRVFFILVSAALLLTNPPRNKFFRAVAGVSAVMVVAWSLGATYSNKMQLLDGLAFLSVGLSVGVSALEYNLKTKEKPETYKLRSSKNSLSISH